MTNSWDEIWNLRKDLYGFLATCLLEPINGENSIVFTREFWSEFPLKPANAQMELGLSNLINTASKLESLSQEQAIEDVMVEYTSLFLGPGCPKAPPCESFYHSQKQLFFGPTAFEVRDVLYAHGLESKRMNKQPEDHIGIELMLLSELSDGLLKSDIEKQMDSIDEQVSFIDNHLLSWIHELSKDAKSHGSTGFYGSLLELIEGILRWDRELIQEYVKENQLLV